jgi:hypothetical protein
MQILDSEAEVMRRHEQIKRDLEDQARLVNWMHASIDG